MRRFAEPYDRPPFRLGAILAGGQSRRFGSPKQLASVGGVLLLERVATALRQAGAHPVAITAPGSPDLSHLLPWRHDLRPGHGPLSGLHAALLWARELGANGTLCVACDLPFANPHLLRRLAEVGERTADTIVVPEGPGGAIEPLFAWYPASLTVAVEERMGGGDLSLRGLLASHPTRRISLSEVTAAGEPETIFLNVNTPEDATRASRLSEISEDDDE